MVNLQAFMAKYLCLQQSCQPLLHEGGYSQLSHAGRQPVYCQPERPGPGYGAHRLLHHLNFITLTFDLDEQTRQAIDVFTAMKIYDSKGLSDVGRQIMVSRAGATMITIENKSTPLQEESK